MRLVVYIEFDKMVNINIIYKKYYKMVPTKK